MKTLRYCILLTVLIRLQAFPQENVKTEPTITAYMRDKLERDQYPSCDNVFTTIDKVIDASDLDSADSYLDGVNRWTMLYDVDGDNQKELIFLQFQGGSQLFPTLYVCKFNKRLMKYKVAKEFNDEYSPVLFKEHLYFIYDDVDNQYRPRSLVIYQLSKELEMVRVSSLTISYSYKIPAGLRSLVREEFLQSLPHLDKAYPSNSDSISWPDDSTMVIGDEDTLKYKFQLDDPSFSLYSQNGINITLSKSGGPTGILEDVWGFDLVESNNVRFIVAAEYLSKVNIRIRIYSVATLRLVQQALLDAQVLIK
jgi:hypothetical protein